MTKSNEMQKQAKEHFRFCGSLCSVYILRLKFQSTLSFSAGWQRPPTLGNSIASQ